MSISNKVSEKKPNLLITKIRNLGDIFADASIKWFPDAFTFAIIISIIVFISALIATPHGITDIADMWYQGFWRLLSFAMQMVLIIVTGFAVATAPLVQRCMFWIAEKINSPRQAIMVTSFFSCTVAFFHWGLALIVSTFIANAIAQSAKSRGIKVHFPLLIATAYGGQVVSQTGLSSSAGLLVNTPGHFLEDKIGLLPLTETIFQPYSLVYVLIITIISPFLLAALHPNKENTVEVSDNIFSDIKETLISGKTSPISPASYLNNSRILVMIIAFTGILLCINYMATKGLLGLEINMLNFTFLMLGIMLHGSAKNYGQAFTRGVSASSGIVLQFPFYAGILGIMMESGLLAMIADWFVSISTPETFPIWSMISAAIINFAVPSAGGQWAVQGPIATEAVSQLGLPQHIAVMTVMMGDQLTNLAQPFWILTILTITGLKVGQVLGYTIILMFAVFITCIGCLLFLI